MGLLSKFQGWRRRARHGRSSRRQAVSAELLRVCRFEEIEPRQLLSASPIQIGAVYFEEATGADLAGDRFEITFTGGAPGTQLTQLVIDTDKLGDGLSLGDTFFDTAAGGRGAFGSVPIEVAEQSGIDSVQFSVDDGGTLMTITFSGFDPGERLVFTVDVDEQGYDAGDMYQGANAVAEGNEFQGSRFTATFAAPHFYEASDADIFFDFYDEKLNQSGLDLPPDNYMPPSPVARPVHTAAAILSIQQTPLPITVAGTVYDDTDLDNRRDAGEPGIGGVQLTLLRLESGQYVTTGTTTTTDAGGNYKFEGVLPGTYRVVETQPAGYFSIGAVAGKVAGSTRGAVTGVDQISAIELLGGEDSAGNDFAEARPATLSGHVFHDANNNGALDSGETGIAGAVVRLQYLPSSGPAPAPIQVTTGTDGVWSAEGLMPGNYRVEELQPAGYLDGLDAAGTAGGAAQNPGDRIDGIRLESGQAGLQYNFGELVPSTISGYTVVDRNGNGQYDGPDTVLSRVTVHLLDAQGNRIASTISDESGAYRFTGLAPGVYGVEEIQPAGYFDGADKVGSAGGNLLGPDSIVDITLTSGTQAVQYNFLEILPSSIRGRVVADANGNGLLDAGEAPIAGVTVHLLDAQGNRIADALTDANGAYAFTNLPPGVYGVEEIQPAGYYDGADKVGTVGGSLQPPDSIRGIILISGTHGAGYDFLEILPSSIRGRAVADANGNGLLDAGEAPIAGVTVHLLDAQGNRIADALTDANGAYAFTNLAPGVYGVEEIQPAGYFDGRDHAGTAGGSLLAPDSITDVTLISGTHGTGYDFLEILPNSIRGRVVDDANGNGLIDAGEARIPGVTVHLLDRQGNRIDSTVTDANGEYQFANLAPGIYGLEEMQPAGYFDGRDHVGTAGGSLLAPDSITEITLISGIHGANYDFLEIRPSSISGRVVADPGEQAIGGVTVHLLDAQGNRIGNTTTNANGEYQFGGLPPGAYGVEEIQPQGYYDGADKVGTAGGSLLTPDSVTGIVLVSGTNAARYDFHERLPVSLSGFVYVDDNDNGQRNPAEAAIPGVSLVLLNAAGNPTGVTTTTDAAGFYRFDGLEPDATYGVAQVQPAGYHDGKDTAGTAGGAAHNPGDQITGIHLASGVSGKNYNFGELRPASIAGRVFLDHDEDGQLDAGEGVLSGVTVYLLDGSGARIGSTATDASGQYAFTNLRPGTYGVEEVQPQGYYDARDYAGSAGGVVANDRITQVVLGSGVAAVEYNFCELTPATISGYVFQDGPTIEYKQGEPVPDPTSLRNGQFTPDDKPIAGVVIQLGDATGAPVYNAFGDPITAVSDSRGYYEFTNLRPGVYTLLQVQPQGYTDSLDTAGSQGGIAVNRNSAIDPMVLQQLVIDPQYDAIVRIPLGAGAHAVSYNFSEVQVKEIREEVPFIPPSPRPDPPLPAPSGPTASPEVKPTVFYQATTARQRRVPLGGGGNPLTYTWHLSVVDAGQPRREGAGDQRMAQQQSTLFNPVSWTGTPLDRGQWILADVNGTVVHQFIFGMEGATPVTGDFDGNGVSEVAIFFDGLWFIDLNGNGVWDEGDLWATLGQAGDQPVTGDWDGDGKDDIGIFGPAWLGDAQAIEAEPGLPDIANQLTGRQKNVPPDPQEATSGWRTLKRTSRGEMRSDVIDHVFQYGTEGDHAVAGDWNGDGVSSIGLFRQGAWYLDVDGDGRWSRGDLMLPMGAERDLPVVGDWNGDGIDDLGLFHDGKWQLDLNGDHKLDANDRAFQLGGANDRPVVGDFNGDGIDEVGVYQDSVSKPDEQAHRQDDWRPAVRR